MTPFIKIPDIFSSRLSPTSDEVAVVISTSDLLLVQNIPEGDKVEMVS